MRPRYMQSHVGNKGSNPKEAWTNLRRALQDHPLLKTRQLPPGNSGREEVATAVEHQATEEIVGKTWFISHTKHTQRNINRFTSFAIDNMYYVNFKI